MDEHVIEFLCYTTIYDVSDIWFQSPARLFNVDDWTKSRNWVLLSYLISFFNSKENFKSSMFRYEALLCINLWQFEVFLKCDKVMQEEFALYYCIPELTIYFQLNESILSSEQSWCQNSTLWDHVVRNITPFSVPPTIVYFKHLSMQSVGWNKAINLQESSRLYQVLLLQRWDPNKLNTSRQLCSRTRVLRTIQWSIHTTRNNSMVVELGSHWMLEGEADNHLTVPLVVYSLAVKVRMEGGLQATECADHRPCWELRWKISRREPARAEGLTVGKQSLALGRINEAYLSNTFFCIYFFYTNNNSRSSYKNK